LIDIEQKDTVLRTFMLFVQTAQIVLKYTDAYLYRKARLSVVKLTALKALETNNGVMTPSEIAEWTQTERHNITTLVRRMKRDGLITAERNINNKKYLNVMLTDKGREVLKQAIPVAKEAVDHVMSSITEDNAALLEKQLRVLRQNTYEALRGITFLANRIPQ